VGQNYLHLEVRRGFWLSLCKGRREKNCGEIRVEDWRYSSRENLISGSIYISSMMRSLITTVVILIQLVQKQSCEQVLYRPREA